MNHHANIVRLRAVANALGDLKDKVVFVGGATVSLYASRPEAVTIRVTDDVDVVVELASTGDFYKLQDQLLERGFKNDTNANIISRFLHNGVILDIMPTDASVLGFTNRWYLDGINHSQDYELDDGQLIRIFSPAFFIASKMEAFKSRGKGDLFGSHDLEDIIFVLDNHDEILEELYAAPDEVIECLKEEFSGLLSDPLFEEALLGHVEQYEQTLRVEKIIGILREFCS